MAADPPQTPPAKAALTVTLATPQSGQMAVQIKANGNITAWQEASVGAELNGLRLSEVRANVGDVVQAGQVLATFSAASVQADLAQARALLAEATASAQEAAANAERARGLQPKGVISAQQFNQYITTEQTAQARVDSAKAAVNIQELRLKQTQVVAPDAGVISARSPTVGAVVPAGAELFRLIRQGRLEWRAEVTAAEVGRIKPGMIATVVATSGAQLSGKVRMLAPTVDPQTRNALVYVDLSSPAKDSGVALAGMFARGVIDLGSTKALTLPYSAVVMRDGFNYVFKWGPDNRVRQLKVQTGRRMGDQIEVLQGLPADAKVVVQGAGFLNEGDVVRVMP